MKHLSLVLLLLFSLSVTPVLSQGDDACPVIVQTVLENLDSICQNTDRNEACYGNIELEAIPRDDVADFQFTEVGDIEGVANIGALRVSGMDTERDVWGVALMRLQANLPDTLPGQNVTFLLFGDVELINATRPDNPDLRPMQAFYLRTGVAQPQCVEAPQDGLMVQTPEGRGQVTFTVNGVSMAMGSTAFFRAPGGEQTQIAMLEGSGAVLGAEGEVVPIIAGTQVNVRLDDTLLPVGTIGDPEPYEPENLQGLPLDVLERQVEPAPPLSDEDVALILNFTRNGLVPCGLADFLPECDDLVGALGGSQCDLDEAGNPDCNIDPWAKLLENEPFSQEELDGFFEQFGGTGNALEDANEPDATSELPPGCYFGICTREPAEACKCVLCGVECPVEPAETEESSPVDCEANPDALGCQTSDSQDTDPGTGSNDNPPSSDPGTDPVPTDPPPVDPVPTDVPVEPTPEPTQDPNCIPGLPICIPPPTQS